MVYHNLILVLFLSQLMRQYEAVEENRDFKTIMTESKNKLNSLDKSFKDIVNSLDEMHDYVVTEESHLNKLVQLAKNHSVPTADILKFNIGGTIFSTLKSTIEHKIKNPENDSYYEPHLFQLLISGIVKPASDEEKTLFIDRDPFYYRHIFHYLRTAKTGKVFQLPKLSSVEFNDFLDEVEYCKLQGLVDLLNPSSLFDYTNILTNDQAYQLNNLIEFEGAKWKLIYRGTKHGFSSQEFHSNCDSVVNTLLLVKSTDGFIFGGYKSVSWENSHNWNGHYMHDQNAFLFSLVNYLNKPKKLACKDWEHAVYCDSKKPAIFGNGHDLYISPHANITTDSYSVLGSTYENAGHVDLFVGTRNFKVLELEVFTKK